MTANINNKIKLRKKKHRETLAYINASCEVGHELATASLNSFVVAIVKTSHFWNKNYRIAAAIIGRYANTITTNYWAAINKSVIFIATINKNNQVHFHVQHFYEQPASQPASQQRAVSAPPPLNNNSSKAKLLVKHTNIEPRRAPARG